MNLPEDERVAWCDRVVTGGLVYIASSADDKAKVTNVKVTTSWMIPRGCRPIMPSMRFINVHYFFKLVTDR